MRIYLTHKVTGHTTKWSIYKSLLGALRKAAEIKAKYPNLMPWIGE